MGEVISEAGAVRDDAAPPLWAHSVHRVSTSVAFLRNWSISKVLEAATWRSNSVFASFYFKIFLMFLSGFGPLVLLLLQVMSLIPRNFILSTLILGIFYSGFGIFFLWD